MNWPDENESTIDRSQLDLLVDGQLDGVQRRSLLAEIDDAPDGWRQLALAFLEAQSWQDALGPLARGEAQTEEFGGDRPGLELRSPRRRLASGRLWKTLLAMAASFLVVLTVGLAAGGFLWPDNSKVAGPIATPPESPLDPRPVLPDRKPEIEAPAEVDDAGDDDRWEFVTLAVGGGPSDGDRSIQLPCREAESLSENWLESYPAPLGPQAVQVLERMGLEVRQSRQATPVQMRDGRQLVVPVDRVELYYVGGQAYQ